MKTKLVLGVAALQVAGLAYLAAEREWVLHTGQTIYLRTAPMDPRDAMRGDYVRLSYDLSRVPRTLCRGNLTNASFEKLTADTRVYAGLRLAENNVGELVGLSREPPSEGLFLRGRTEPSYGDYLQVRYGLEAYFLEQGRGTVLEQGRSRDGIQVPLEMKVAVSSSGLAILKDHRWCALGMGVDFETKETLTADGRRQRRFLAANIKWLNASSNDVALVNLAGGGSLALVPAAQGGEPGWRWLAEGEAQPAPGPDSVVVLKPNRTYSIRAAFDDPRWSVQKQEPGSSAKARPHLLSDLQSLQDWSARFRFEYRPPDKGACAGLPNAAIIWHGKLSSRAFNASGVID
jgi:uncharacterized membrane-anchored protein